MIRVGIIHIGSSKIRLMLAEVEDVGYFKIIDELKTPFKVCYELSKECVLCNEKLSTTFQPGDHGSTFGGNPVVCAGASSVLNQLCNTNSYSEIIFKGKLIKETILNENLEIVKDVRGLGLMLGIEIDGDSSIIQKKALENGLLVLTAGKNVIRLLPPLNISVEDVKEGLKILVKVLKEYK